MAMTYGVMSDTHSISDEVIRSIVYDEFVPRGVKVIFHLGDVEKQHVKAELFADLPVVCVLIKRQRFDPDFTFAPANWSYVRPSMASEPPAINGNFDEATKAIIDRLQSFIDLQKITSRIVNVGELAVYAGHERSFDALKNPERVREFFNQINQVYDGIRWALTGHTHHQFVFRHGFTTWINPGAVDYSANGYEFAIFDPELNEVVCSRLRHTESHVAPATVGIVSDTGNISERDEHFWENLVLEFTARDVTKVIICGDFSTRDIGRPELQDLDVHYFLLPGQENARNKPDNWHLIFPENPIVDICGHRFYVQDGLGAEMGDFSEMQRAEVAEKIMAQHKRVDFIVTGLMPETVLQESSGWTFINPGDARNHRYFATICLPRKEYTLGTVRM